MDRFLCCGGSDERPPNHTVDCPTRVVGNRAFVVGELPHVRKWMRRFAKVVMDMPPEVWVYVASGVVHVMVKGEDGKEMYRRGVGSDGVDQDGSIAIVAGGHFDGGDW